MFDMKSCLVQASPSKKVYDITPIVHMNNYNALRAHFRENMGAVVLLCRTHRTACIFEYFNLTSNHLVFHNGSMMQMKHAFCERHPRAARQTLSKYLQDADFWNCRICEQSAKEDALSSGSDTANLEAHHWLQCGNLLCYPCLRHMLFAKAPWQHGNKVPIPCPMCRNPWAFVCSMTEAGSERRIHVDVYGLSAQA